MNIDIASSDPMPEATERLLRELPEWFGIEDALQDYVASACLLPTYAARGDGTTVGVCLVKRHSDHAAEIYLLAVARHLHRNGIGRALLEIVEQDLAAEAHELLQVKTLGASQPSPEYAATRRFYEASGYRHLEEFDAGTLWPENPCLLMVKPLAAA